MDRYDVVVIGAGPGGYVAAIRAAQLGGSVAVIEQDTVGGTCLNVGCIPTKALVHSAHVYHVAESAAQFGVKFDGLSFDYGAAAANKDKIVSQLTRGVGGLLKANGVEIIAGTARFTGSDSLDVDGSAIGFGSCIIATGSHPTRPPIPGIDSDRCVDSTGLLAIEELPKRLIVLGGGVIGSEFASIFSRLGTEVTLVEMLPRLCAMEDADATDVLEKELSSRGVNIVLDSRVERIESTSTSITAIWDGEESGSAEADLILVATGRAPTVGGLGLETAGVEWDERTGVVVEDSMRTTASNIYAIGDVAGKYQLAHTASREGEVAAENAMGHSAVVDYKAVPRVVYTDPEIAAVGLTESEAREQHGDNLFVGVFPFAANSRAAIYGDRTGFVKVIAEQAYGELLGVVMVGGSVSDMISAGVNAIEAESTIETIAYSIQAHPTLAESLKEAALDALGQVVHMPPKRQPVGAGR